MTTAMAELTYAAEPGAAFVPAGTPVAVDLLVLVPVVIVAMVLDPDVPDDIDPLEPLALAVMSPPGVTLDVARAARAIKSVRFFATVGLMTPTIPLWQCLACEQ